MTPRSSGWLALLALALALPLALAADAPLVRDDPHGRPDRCGACHQAGPSPEAPGAALPIVETCRSCHPTADMHPVGMAPDEVRVPEGWPLEQGRMTCATCHTEPAHDPEVLVAAVSPWHRGGPYEHRTDLCYQCHVRAEYTRTNPHEASTAPREAACAACHSALPEPDAAVADALLRLAADEVCTTCHPGPAHAGAAEHLGKPVPAPTPALPLLDGDRIACFTCHEVHDGVPASLPTPLGEAFRARALARDWATLADPALSLRWPGAAGTHAQLTMPGDALCRTCHSEMSP